MKENNDFYLEKITLMGYKSIQDVDINFVPGLNILIGKNAAGKTNFLEFLDKSLSFDYDDMFYFHSSLYFSKGKDKILLSAGKAYPPDFSVEELLASKANVSLTINDKKIKLRENTFDKSELATKGIRFSNVFIRHGIPKEYQIVDTPLSFTVGQNIFPNEIIDVVRATDSNFVKSLCFSLVSTAFNFEPKKSLEMVIREVIDTTFKPLEKLKEILIEYSSINDIRLSDNLNMHTADSGKTFVVSNLFLEFKIGDDWLPFSSLSDGTKRIFYIISDSIDFYGHLNEVYKENFQSILSIILIEEPELGVHPHQFRKIMTFLKEESLNKQIIISTHSPQALNILGKDDLNKIIVAYSTPEGTQLKHLSEREIEKAKAYIDEDFLSDYWLYSDLER